MSITVIHNIAGDRLALGVVRVEGAVVAPAPPALVAATEALLVRRQAPPLSPQEELRRSGSREMLRQGRYKPTGRGKPASEYLWRAAREPQAFPRINGLVDAVNLVSLTYMVPVSLWDLDLAGSRTFEFRLGQPDESYVFNAAGQLLALGDLICGCAVDGPAGADRPRGCSRPIVSPIKDSLATKVTPATRRVAACVYLPARATTTAERAAITEDLLRWLGGCARPTAQASIAVLGPGEQAAL